MRSYKNTPSPSSHSSPAVIFMEVMGGAAAAAAAASPEFEFWMVGNNRPAESPTRILTADELFADGVLLPLHHLSINHSDTSAGVASSPTVATPTAAAAKKGKAEQRRKVGGSAGGAAELNIHIWPFTRSRSAGWARARPRVWSAAAVIGRKSSSAPCSRSNSRGESSKSSATATATAPAAARKWGRVSVTGGIHLGRHGPVWLPRRSSSRGREEKNEGVNKKGGIALNVKTCVGCKRRVSCRTDDKNEAELVAAGDGGGGGGSGGGGGGGLVRLRAFFSKKVH